MPRFHIRIIALFLVPCLFTEPVAAISANVSLFACSRGEEWQASSTLFSQQALSPLVLAVQHNRPAINNWVKLFAVSRYQLRHSAFHVAGVTPDKQDLEREAALKDAREHTGVSGGENQNVNPQAILEEALRIIDRRWELGENYEVAALLAIGSMFEEDGLLKSAFNCYGKAIEVATAGLTEYSGSVSPLKADQARIQWKLGNNDRAKELYNEALDDAKRRRESKLPVLSEMIDAGLIPEVLAAVKKPSFGAYEKTSDMQAAIAEHLARSGHPEEAINLAKDLSPSFSSAIRAIAESRRGNFKKSIEFAAQAEWDSYKILSEVSRLRDETKFEDALQLLGALKLGAGTLVKELLASAELQIKAGHFQQAREPLERVTQELEKDAAQRITHIENPPQVYARVGAAMAAVGDLDEARKLFAKAYEITPVRGDDDRSYDDMAAIATAQADAGLYEEALAIINEATQHHPEELIKARIHLAKLLMKTEADRARELLENGGEEASHLPDGEFMFSQLVLTAFPMGIDTQKYLDAAVAEVWGTRDPYYIAPAVPAYIASNRLSELISALDQEFEKTDRMHRDDNRIKDVDEALSQVVQHHLDNNRVSEALNIARRMTFFGKALELAQMAFHLDRKSEVRTLNVQAERYLAPESTPEESRDKPADRSPVRTPASKKSSSISTPPTGPVATLPVVRASQSTLAGALLKTLRVMAHFSQTDLGKASGFSMLDISYLERGMADFTPEVAERIGAVLKVPASEFLPSPADGKEVESILANTSFKWPLRIIGFLLTPVPLQEIGHNVEHYGILLGIWESIRHPMRLFKGQAYVPETPANLLAGPMNNVFAGLFFLALAFTIGDMVAHPIWTGWLWGAAIGNLFWAAVEPPLSFLLARGDIFKAYLHGTDHPLIRYGQAFAQAA